MANLEDLKNAIILQAVEDYAKAFLGYKDSELTPDDMMKDCENFFKGDYYKLMTDLDSDLIIKVVKNREIDKVLDFIKRFKERNGQVRLVYKESGKGGKQKTLTIPPRLTEDFIKAIDKLEIELIQEKETLK